MKSKVYLFLGLITLLMSSCSSLKYTASSQEVENTLVSFTVADVDVQADKIYRTTSWGYNPFRKVSVETVKSNTTAIMLKEADADVLIEPEYIVEKRGFLRGGSVTVIGYPAKYSNFHKMTNEEAEILKSASGLMKENCKKKKRFFFF